MIGQRGCCNTCNGMLLSHKEDDTVPLETKWMDPKTIMLSGISQMKKGKNHIVLSICGI